MDRVQSAQTLKNDKLSGIAPLTQDQAEILAREALSGVGDAGGSVLKPNPNKPGEWVPMAS